jgi:Spy/CpxP family protein refolding chaperone
MKNFILILTIILMANSVFAQSSCNCSSQTKCLDLITSMYNERATLYNVLDLSADQQKCKDVIDKKRYKELNTYFEQYKQEEFVLSRMCEHQASSSALKKQEKVVKNLDKDIKKISEKYDNEFKSVLNSEQKSKLKYIRRMEKKEIKYCQKNKAFYKRDPKVRPFGEKMYYTDTQEVLCPKHNKWHMFGFKHENNLNK